MYLPSKGNCTLNSPLISLNLQTFSFVPKFKYLGSFITQDNSDDENMRRQRGNCYARSNGIIKHFYACSPVVTFDIFKAFCCNMYCSHLWCDFKNETLRRLIVGYNHSFRIIMKYIRHCSAIVVCLFSMKFLALTNCGGKVFMVLGRVSTTPLGAVQRKQIPKIRDYYGSWCSNIGFLEKFSCDTTSAFKGTKSVQQPWQAHKDVT